LLFALVLSSRERSRVDGIPWTMRFPLKVQGLIPVKISPGRVCYADFIYSVALISASYKPGGYFSSGLPLVHKLCAYVSVQV